MSNLCTLRTRDGQTYKMPAGNVTKGALDSVFTGDCRVLECNGMALAPASNGVFVGTLPGHTYTVYMIVKDPEEDKPTLFGRVGRKMLGKRHVPTRDEVHKVFVHYDRDGSGSIDMAEFRALVASLGLLIPAEEVENTFKAIDLDDSGTLEFEEFFQWFHAAKKHKNSLIRNKVRKLSQKAGLISITDPEVIRRAFMAVDTDGSGAIDPKEFFQCCTNMKLKVTEAEAKQIFDSIDLDGNGTLEFSEFLTWWQSMTRGKGKKTMLAHNLRHSLFEHAATELAAINVTHEKDDDEDETENSWNVFGKLGSNWELPSAGSKLSEASWFKQDGIVMLRGCVISKSGADATVATLPEGCRPSSVERFQCMSTSVKEGKTESAKCRPCPVAINPDGTITVHSKHEGELWFSGITFTVA